MKLCDAIDTACKTECGIKRAWWREAEVTTAFVPAVDGSGFTLSLFVYGEPWHPSGADIAADDWELTPHRPTRPPGSSEPMRKRAVEKPPRQGLSKLALATSILSLVLAMLSLLLR